MLAKIATLFIAASAALSAAATPIDSSCNVGSVQCCNSMHAPGSYSQSAIAALVGVVAQDISGQVGLQCNPITGIGAGVGANCASAPVCCEKNFTNQLVGVNCTPVTVGV
ncbi:fungal hydrophobin-domain-containing protein [Panaeolus papilionaceus]|nr:fungal hydrophobin-domain-containing protein [Panaeolus papilionaceus]